jgi:hypothetical protein
VKAIRFHPNVPAEVRAIAFSTGKTLTAERRPAQNTAGQTRIRGKSGADQNTPFVLVDKTPKAKLRDGAS